MATIVRPSSTATGLVDYKDVSSDEEEEEGYIVNPKRIKVDKSGKGILKLMHTHDTLCCIIIVQLQRIN